MAKVLVADDEHGICQAFAELLRREGHEALLASTGDEALGLVASEAPDLAFLDVKMPGMSGLEVLAQLQNSHPHLPVVVMTAYGTMDTAIHAVQHGAFDYIGKPVELSQVRKLLQRALHKPEAELSMAPSPTAVPTADEHALVGQSAAMQEIFKLVSLLTQNQMTVLVTGETGVGKELVARAIHSHGIHKDEPFVAVNCAAIPENLVESELFGHEKGAFTGAHSRRTGRFEAAGQGTLFLDEVSELPLQLQSKLLRVLQERSYEPVGSVKPRPVHARIIAASNNDLQSMVEQDRFREDLYHRLNLVALRIPPLRKRPSDIPLLAMHFLRRCQAELNKTISGIEPAVMTSLQAYSWPGNVRELEHCIKRAAMLVRGPTLTTHDLDLDAGPPSAPLPGDDYTLDLAGAARRAFHGSLHAAPTPAPDLFHSLVAVVERALVEEALACNGNNQVSAARVLGLHRTTLRKKLGETPQEPPTDPE
jgi:DNA-binding NtrC family response regulator